MSDADWVVVYRGFTPAALDLVESMLRVEQLEPRRLGKTAPSLLGAGEWAVEQLIEVPREHEQTARALIAASEQLADPARAEDLDAQAREAAPSPPSGTASANADGRRFGALAIGMITAAVFVLYLWLRLR